ncbi:MAG: hypothetical protein ACRDNZ_23280 [Streptosporangiaceae bacterium]
MTNLDKWWREQVQIEEASLRYLADLPPRSDREQEFYRTWAEYEGGDSASPGHGDSYGDYLRSKTPENLRDLAEATVEAQREAYSPPPDWLGEPEQSPSGDADLEAGS